MGIPQNKNPKFKLRELIFNSSLDGNQKNLWDKLINYILDEEALSIINSLEDNIDNLNFFTKNLQSKLEALKNQNQDYWLKIIEEEKEFASSQA